MNLAKAVLCLALLAVLVLPALAEIDLSTGNEAVIDPTVPLPQDGSREIMVLWDLTHGVYLNYQPSGSFSDLTALLAANGYAMSTTSAGIDNIDLTQYDILVITVLSSWNSAYTASEVTAVEDFLEGGGALLIMGENANCPCGNINPVAQAFGTTTGLTNISPNDLYFSNFIAHSIFDGISQLYFRAAGALSYAAPSVEAAWTSAGETVITIYEPCKMVATADGNFCDNSYLSGDNIPFILNVFECLGTDQPIPTRSSTWGAVKADFK